MNTSRHEWAFGALPGTSGERPQDRRIIVAPHRLRLSVREAERDLQLMPSLADVAPFLAAKHYLGPSRRGNVYMDPYGVMVFANPSSRRLPQQDWLELVRWCIDSRVPNAGSRQWAACRRWLLATYPDVTTLVSYSDPSQGHTGALYRACNWEWAPTWLRLREPPSGNGTWTGDKVEAVKDRWVFPLRSDERRAALLQVQDASLMRRMAWASYPGDYKRWVAERRQGVA